MEHHLVYGGSVGGNTTHIAPEVHNSTRYLAGMTRVSSPLLVDYDKQPVFDSALCIYAIITKNKEALPNYPTNFRDVAKVGAFFVWNCCPSSCGVTRCVRLWCVVCCVMCGAWCVVRGAYECARRLYC